jgi:hypothetical protein
MSQWEGTYWHVLLLLGILRYRREVIDVLAEPEAVVARSMRRSGGLRHWKPHIHTESPASLTMHSVISWFNKRTLSLVAGDRDVTVIKGRGALELRLVNSVELAVELLVIEPAHGSGQWRVLEGWQGVITKACGPGAGKSNGVDTSLDA